MDPIEVDQLETERAQLKARLVELRPVMTEVRRIQRRLNALDRMQRGEVTVHPPRTAGYLPTEERKLQILALLERRPELRRKEVAEALELTRARAGQLVNLMVDDGLVDDRRAGGLVITDAGRRLLDDRHPEQPVVEIRPGPLTVAAEGED